MPAEILDRSFYNRRPQTVARQLLGKLLVSTMGGKRAAGIIVETEAYLADADSACHGFRGQTPRNGTMFGPPGHGYVYAIHAKFCFNAVTQPAGRSSAVLVRALQPTLGYQIMAARRGKQESTALCSGPGKLCQALDIDASTDGINLCSRRNLWIEEQSAGLSARHTIIRTSRIGVTSAQSLALRFVFEGHRYASGPRRLNRRP